MRRRLKKTTDVRTGLILTLVLSALVPGIQSCLKGATPGAMEEVTG